MPSRPAKAPRGRRAFLEAVAARYGRTEPSPDDLLLERWPRYHIDVIHTKGYHADFVAVVRLVEGRTVGTGRHCKLCGDEIPRGNGSGTNNRRYCKGECSTQAARMRHNAAARVPKAEAALIVELYKSGLSQYVIGRRVCRSDATIRKVVKDAGLEVRTSYRSARSDSMSPTLGQVA